VKDRIRHHEDTNAFLTERVVVLGIAYHNLGVEEEMMRHIDRAVRWYEKAYRLAADHLGPKEVITESFLESLNEAKTVLAESQAESGPPTKRPSTSSAFETAAAADTASVASAGSSIRQFHLRQSPLRP